MPQPLISRTNEGRLRLGALVWVIAIVALLAVVVAGSGCRDGGLTGTMSTDDERRLGADVASEIEKQYKFVDDPAVVRRVFEVSEPIFNQAIKDRSDTSYSVRVINDPEVNAFSIPGGHVYIYKGLLDKLGTDDDALACVIAHETAHVVRRHVVKQITKEQQAGLLVDVAAIVSRSNTVGNVGGLAADLQDLHFSRQDEYEADRYGLRFAYNAGYDPQGMLRTFHILEVVSKGSGVEAPYAVDHPITRNRALRALEQLRELRANRGEYMSASYDPNGDRLAAQKNGIDYNALVLATPPPAPLPVGGGSASAGAGSSGTAKSH